MKVLIIGTRFSSIPCIDGGAIEKLIDEYIEYNAITQKVEIVVYSAKPSSKAKLKSKKNVTYRFINRKTKKYKIMHLISGTLRKIINYFFKMEIMDEYAYFVYKDLKKLNEIKLYDKIIILNNINNATFFSKKIKGKHILYLHNDYLNVKTKNNKKIVASLDEIWCVSKFIKKRVDEIVYNNKTKVIYNGVNLIDFNNDVSENQLKKLKQEYKINENDFVILYTGRIMKIKGVYELIKSFISFSKYNNAKLFVVGNVVDAEKEYGDKIKKITKKINNVIFLGYRDHSFISAFSKIVDVQVVPSIGNEAFGLTVVEGLASGNLMIVSDAGGIPEIVDKNCAIVVNHKNIESDLVLAFNKIYKLNKKQKIKMKKYAIIKANEFSIEKFRIELEKNVIK